MIFNYNSFIEKLMKEITANIGNSDEFKYFFITSGESDGFVERICKLSSNLPENKRFNIRSREYFEFSRNIIRVNLSGDPKIGVRVVYNCNTGEYSSNITNQIGFDDQLPVKI